MNIFITGSNGFLGSYFKNFNNLNEHNLIYGSTSNSTDCIIFENLYSDIEKKLRNIDIIIHFASIIPETFEKSNYDNVFLTNTGMLNNLFNFAVKDNIKKFIYISGFGSMNQPEKYDIKDFYTLSKITGEHFCSLMESKGIQAASLRVSSPYGEFYRVKNVLSIFVEKALKNEDINVFGTGKRKQNFTYAGDVINAILLCVQRDISGIYNIVGKENTSMLELAKNIVDLTGSKSKIITGQAIDPNENYNPSYNYKRAQRELGYKPEYSIKEGLKRYINWKKVYENSFNI